MVDFLRYAVTHKAFIAALLTVASVALAHFGIVLPVIPHELVTAVLAALTGVFGVTTDEAAFLSGLLEGLETARATGPTEP